MDLGCCVVFGLVVEYFRLGFEVFIGENCIISSFVIVKIVVLVYFFLCFLSVKINGYLKYFIMVFGM